MPQLDIIVPVWNRPVETRSCLVSLIEHSPDARLILLNNGSDRETERLLEEFAESLDERALLITNSVNSGFVRSVNQGLARSEAELTAVVRNSSIVTKGWLEPLLTLAGDRHEAGILIPRLVERSPNGVAQGKSSPGVLSEISFGDFAAMLIRREVYERVGGFDEEMEGGVWCLKDYSRRSLKAGFLTFIVEGAPVYYSEPPPLGSVARREDVLARSVTSYNERWGPEKSFAVYFPRNADIAMVRRHVDVMVMGARQGHCFHLLVSPGTFLELSRDGYHSVHRNIRLDKLPRLFPAGRLKKLTESLRIGTPEMISVSGIDGIPFPDTSESISFPELEAGIHKDEADKYGRGGTSNV